ncbi:MAG: SAM-dependent chlorinase/fluorinase [Nitrososphaerota archaeon]|nr:SAM-dependent chlorinase/fluorinase [Aigarchaeota archaeon]MDW8077176.1 SAM-dependent chlorinase/fluorinase [Nitrososphaerota archaeon]
MKRKPIITLTTDYGLEDPYVAEVKAKILSVIRDVQIVDITHAIPSFDERRGAFILITATKHFPKGTIHICVVDPKVGTERKGIIVVTKLGHIFVGPDTGLMWPAASMAGILSIYEIDQSKIPPRTCETFHGRDVFAYVAAKLASGVKPSKLGKKIKNMMRMESFEPTISDGWLCAELMHIDKFGNLITNVSKESLALLGSITAKYEVELGDKRHILPLCRTYGEVPVGSMLMVFGGTGFLEIAVNMGNAAEIIGIKVGERIRIRRGQASPC